MKRTRTWIAATIFLLLLFVPICPLTKGDLRIGTIFVWWAYPTAVLTGFSGQWAECLFSLLVIALHISLAITLAWIIVRVWERKKTANQRLERTGVPPAAQP